MPDDGEVAGLLALMILTEARRTARISASGELVTLDEQDREAWGAALVSEVSRLPCDPADLLRRLSRIQQARAAYDKAIELAGNTAETAYLTRRRDQWG